MTTKWRLNILELFLEKFNEKNFKTASVTAKSEALQVAPQ